MLLCTHRLVDDHQSLSETTGAVKLVSLLFIACAFCILLGNKRNVALAKHAISPITAALALLLHKSMTMPFGRTSPSSTQARQQEPRGSNYWKGMWLLPVSSSPPLWSFFAICLCLEWWANGWRAVGDSRSGLPGNAPSMQEESREVSLLPLFWLYWYRYLPSSWDILTEISNANVFCEKAPEGRSCPPHVLVPTCIS